MNNLDILAQKLGVATEYLWGVLLKQAPISGAVDLFIIIALMVVYVVIYKHREKIHDGFDSDNFLHFMGAIMFIAIIAIITLLELCSLSYTIAAFINPEYWALHEILQALNK